MIPALNRGGIMKGFVQGADRQQTTLLPECLDDWVDESNPVRAVDVFVDALELGELGFDGVTPAATGRPGYHPSPMTAGPSRRSARNSLPCAARWVCWRKRALRSTAANSKRLTRATTTSRRERWRDAWRRSRRALRAI